MRQTGVVTLHVEYAGGSIQYCILFIFGLFYEYSNLEYIRIHIISRVNQAEYGIHIRVVAPQEYVNIYSTRRVVTCPVGLCKILLYFKVLVNES